MTSLDDVVLSCTESLVPGTNIPGKLVCQTIIFWSCHAVTLHIHCMYIATVHAYNLYNLHTLFGYLLLGAFSRKDGEFERGPNSMLAGDEKLKYSGQKKKQFFVRG